MPANTLVCPFLTEDPVFAYGVEFGMLFARMRAAEDPIEDFFCRENQDRILLLAGRLGWHVVRLKPWDRDWFWVSLQKQPAPAL